MFDLLTLPKLSPNIILLDVIYSLLIPIRLNQSFLAVITLKLSIDLPLDTVSFEYAN